LSFENVFVFHAHAFNFALLLAVDPPTAQEAQTKPGAQWEAQMDMKYDARCRCTDGLHIELSIGKVGLQR
jgi:hypothetical protein